MPARTDSLRLVPLRLWARDGWTFPWVSRVRLTQPPAPPAPSTAPPLGRGQGRPRDGRRGQSYVKHRAFFAGVLDESRRTLDEEHTIPHHGGHDLPGPPLSDDVIERLRRVLRRPAAGRLRPAAVRGSPDALRHPSDAPGGTPRRSGAEVAHLILVILALVVDLAASLLDVVTSFTEGASGPVPHILSSLLFNAPPCG